MRGRWHDTEASEAFNFRMKRNELQKWIEMVAGFRDSETLWPEDERPIEIIQTHISVILLGKHHVLKLKKPVDFGFLDYTTLEKRRLSCQREVELNRRLCPEIYIGTRTIIKDRTGFRYAEDGKVVEYGVLMKRLPEDSMLSGLVESNRVTEDMIDRVARRLHRFHQTAARSIDIDYYGGLENIRYNWTENFEQAERFIDRTISAREYVNIRSWVETWMEEYADLLDERVGLGHICDGHGDVRCESVCLTEPVSIFDCIEFNDRFRCADVANEAAFLAMDLEAYGRPDLGYFFFERYAELDGDENLFDLFTFYRCYRAFVRGKVLSFQLDEAELSQKERMLAADRARDYFEIAARAATPLKTPTLIVVAGRSGTGKTSVARALGCDLGIRVVSSDAVRKAILGAETAATGYGQGIYSEDATRITYEKMMDLAAGIFESDGNVILDGTFLLDSERDLAKRSADSFGAEYRLIECVLRPDLVRQRLKERAEKKDGLSDATWETYQRQNTEIESVRPVENSYLALDNKNSLLENSRRAGDWLRETAGSGNLPAKHPKEREMEHQMGF